MNQRLAYSFISWFNIASSSGVSVVMALASPISTQEAYTISIFFYFEFHRRIFLKSSRLLFSRKRRIMLDYFKFKK
jgi:hypothetical protein